MRALMDSLPPMRPLVMVLKVFLQQRELNEASRARCPACMLVLPWVVCPACLSCLPCPACFTSSTDSSPPPPPPNTLSPPLQVYSGGLGSYALLVMVAAFLQLHPSRLQASAQRYGSGGKSSRALAAKDLEGSLGVLLVDFFRLFGRSLNNQEVRPEGGL